jgi:hypothetical protein
MSRKPLSANMRDVARPPEGENFCYLTGELINSPAWKAQSIHCRRLIDFLMLEHLNHGGKENGFLKAPFAQLQASGIGRRYIAPAIREAEALGLLRVRHGALRALQLSALNLFRLTFYHSKETNDAGGVYWIAGTHEWKRTTSERATTVKKSRPRSAPPKKKPGAQGGTETGHSREPIRSQVGTGEPQKSANRPGSRLATPIYISGDRGEAAEPIARQEQPDASLWLTLLAS